MTCDLNELVPHLQFTPSHNCCFFQIEDSEVELWVVKAITAKLIDCRIDQLNQVILVRYVII